MRHRIFPFFALLVIATLALAACAAPTSPSKPATRIDSPASNSTVTEGEELAVQSTSTDPRGIVQVDLLVDGQVIRSDQAPGGPQASYTVIQKWTATGPGQHVVSVQALNKESVVGDQASIAIVVTAAGPAPANTATATVAATTTPTATATATEPAPTATATLVPPTVPPSPVPCRNVATFVNETIPDGTQSQPGQQFNKSWTIRNDGNCPWNAAYQLVWVGGEQMTTVSAVAVPNTAPGSTATLIIAMTAPTQPGGHGGQWQFRDPQGAPFATAPLLTVNIVTIAPTPVPCIPILSGFGADRTTINRGESTVLRWGKVDSAERVEIDNGIGGVGTPGDRVVAPQQTTTYTLRATCGGNARTAQVTINVIQPQPTPVPPTPVPPTPVPPTPVPQRRNISGHWVSGNHSMQLTEAIGCGGPECHVTGDYAMWTGGTPETATVNGTVNVYTGAVSLTIAQEMPGAPAKTFNGTLSEDSNRLSGNLSDMGDLTFHRQ